MIILKFPSGNGVFQREYAGVRGGGVAQDDARMMR